MKRWIALLCALCALCTGVARAERSYGVNAESGAFLMRGDGTVITRPGAYDRIAALDGAHFAGCRNGKAALLNADGKPLTAPEYEALTAVQGGAVFKRGDFYGILHWDGTLLLDALARRIVANGDDFFALGDDPYDDIPDEIILVRADGSLWRTGVYTSADLRDVCEGRMAFMDERGRFGYVDGAGEIAVAPQFLSAEDFKNGCAVVHARTGCGVIEPNGAFVLEPVWDAILRTDEALIAIEYGEECNTASIFDLQGQELLTLRAPALSVGALGRRLIVTTREAQIVCDETGTQIASLPRGARIAVGAGEQLIVRSGAWGEACADVLTADGLPLGGAWQHLIPVGEDRYLTCSMRTVRYASGLNEGVRLSVDYASLRYGLIDDAGKILCEAECTCVQPLGDGLFLLQREDGFAVIGADGTVLCEGA